MKLLRVAWSTLAALILLGSSASAADNSPAISIRVLNGKTNKPIVNQRLVIFAGETREDIHSHLITFDVYTDAHGVPKLSVEQSKLNWLQVWTEWQHLCQTQPNSSAFDVHEIASNGIVAQNNCSRIVGHTNAGELVIYARPETFGEGMRH